MVAAAAALLVSPASPETARGATRKPLVTPRGTRSLPVMPRGRQPKVEELGTGRMVVWAVAEDGVVRDVAGSRGSHEGRRRLSLPEQSGEGRRRLSLPV